VGAQNPLAVSLRFEDEPNPGDVRIGFEYEAEVMRLPGAWVDI
jgi:hypothetical protein